MNSIWLNAVRASGGAKEWYLAGGAPMPVAAYQPLGAASLAASYVNLANPGTFDAAPGVAPTHSGATGWGFAGTEHLTTGIVATSADWTYIVRFSDVPLSGTRTLIGARVEAPFRQIVWMQPYAGADLKQYRAGGSSVLNTAPAAGSGVMGQAGGAAFFDGAGVGTIGTGSVADIVAFYIGAANNAGVTQDRLSGNIQALAIYSSTLTAPQVAAVSAAMAALT